MKNLFKRIRLICVHRFWVFYFCCKFGIPIQGLLHDWSKFTPSEFFPSVKYYESSSVSDKSNEKAIPWKRTRMLHKLRNKHHYEYWQTAFDGSSEPQIVPYKYLLEMLCDYLGAGKAYFGKTFSFDREYDWWIDKTGEGLKMHQVNMQFIEEALRRFSELKEIPKIIKVGIDGDYTDVKIQDWLFLVYCNERARFERIQDEA